MGKELFPGKRFTVEIQPVIAIRPTAPFRHDHGRRELAFRDTCSGCAPDPHINLVLNTAPIEEHDGQTLRPAGVLPYITVDGYMTPCCTTFDTSIYQYTNILFTPMAGAWISPCVTGPQLPRKGDQVCEGCCFDIGGLLRRPEAAGRGPRSPSLRH